MGCIGEVSFWKAIEEGRLNGSTKERSICVASQYRWQSKE